MELPTTLVIRPNSPNPIDRIPNLHESQKILGNKSAKNILNEFRHRVTVKRNNVPPVAFTVLGHGLEKPEYKVVPKGCILVVPTASGQGTKASVSITNNLILMQMANRNFILDPLRYKKELYEMFGPVTIFTEGDKYPNFRYKLFGFYNLRAIQPDSKRPSLLRQSGFIRINADESVNPLLVDTLLSDRSVFTGKNTHYRKSPGIVSIRTLTDEEFDTPIHLVDGELPDLTKYAGLNDKEINTRFGGSILTINPEAEAIINRLNLPELLKFSNGFEDKFNPAWLTKILADDIIYFKKSKPINSWVDVTVGIYLDELLSEEDFVITQEELFERAGKGVYYNFICRNMSQNTPSANPFKLGIAEMHRISEAETHRKGFLHDVLSGAGKKSNKNTYHIDGYPHGKKTRRRQRK